MFFFVTLITVVYNSMGFDMNCHESVDVGALKEL